MDGTTTPEWREPLPDSCPVPTASPLLPQELLRLVSPGNVSQKDFDSHAALGYECNDASRLCEWHSCSMFLPTVPSHRLRDMTKFKRLRDKTAVAVLQVHQQAGVGVVAPSAHVDFWMRRDFDPVANIVKVIGLHEL
jgi:hypothetical protein